MSAYGITGTLVLSPTTAATGGTAIGNIEARMLAFTIPVRMRHFRVGRAADQIKTFYHGGGVLAFAFRGRDVSANTLDMHFRQHSTSGVIKGNTSRRLVAATTVALVVRPIVTTEKYLYAPAMSIITGDPRLLFSPDMPFLAEDEIIMIATRAAGVTTPAFAVDSAANIDALYSLDGGGGV
jgi:hypothetical protein